MDSKPIQRLLVRPQIALMTRSRRRPGVDLEEALSAVSETVRVAYQLASEELVRLGIRHVVCGGLAVGAHGHPRATKDVDFLVGDEAFEHRGPIVTSRVPFQVAGVAVDVVQFPDAPFLDAELSPPRVDSLAKVVSIEALFYMKLRAFRMQDRADMVSLLKVGADPDAVQSYLAKHSPQWIERFAMMVQAAQEE